MDDGFQKDLKTLLDQELTIEHICVSEALIQKTMAKAAEQTVITHGEKPKRRGLNWRGVCAAAAVLVVMGISIPVLLDGGSGKQRAENAEALDMTYFEAGGEGKMEQNSIAGNGMNSNTDTGKAEECEEEGSAVLDDRENAVSAEQNIDQDALMKSEAAFLEKTIVLHADIEKEAGQYEEVWKLIEESASILLQDEYAAENRKESLVEDGEMFCIITYLSDSEEIELSFDVFGYIYRYDKMNETYVSYLAESADEMQSRIKQIFNY